MIRSGGNGVLPLDFQRRTTEVTSHDTEVLFQVALIKGLSSSGLLQAMNASGASHRLEVGESLTFSNHATFRAAYQPLLDHAGAREIVVDLRKTQYIDSAALGMLLMLRKAAELKGIKVALAYAPGTVGEILTTVHFGDLFELRST